VVGFSYFKSHTLGFNARKSVPLLAAHKNTDTIMPASPEKLTVWR